MPESKAKLLPTNLHIQDSPPPFPTSPLPYPDPSLPHSTKQQLEHFLTSNTTCAAQINACYCNKPNTFSKFNDVAKITLMKSCQKFSSCWRSELPQCLKLCTILRVSNQNGISRLHIIVEIIYTILVGN